MREREVFVALLGLLFVGVGVLVLITGNAERKRCTVNAIGTVVEIKREEKLDSDNHYEYTYYPIIRYQAGDQTVTKQSSSGSSNNSKLSIGAISVSSSDSKYHVNDNIEIMYNPDNIEEFVIKGDNGFIIVGIICIILGSIATVFGIKK